MLDAVATRAQTDGPAITSGYDDDFREIVVVSTPNRISERQEQDSIFIPSQVEDPVFDQLQQFSAGNLVDFKMTLVWARKDLECAGLLVPDTGECLVRSSDRLVSIRDKCMNVVHAIRTPPGLYVVEVRPLFGLAQRKDLYLVTLDDREQGVRH